MARSTLTSPHGDLVHRPSGAGETYWGPQDLYRFLVTGEETGGAYFAMEAVVRPGGAPARMILTFTPANMEHFFREALERADDLAQSPPDNLDEVTARYVEAAPRHGLEFIVG